ncbi:hypothetical protein K490DRAFT_67890 [Saccharata proteae CBS 121410]|uniref:Uncharacterized protein n=1 Tax=Saccharata proteae CBS 121410 TaxID=1314787 RepID=A0A9P4HRS2_9PEZI|nr:hypothetical protein K490DRAFT_67890 [Saccharata proteae CBS 121410]
MRFVGLRLYDSGSAPGAAENESNGPSKVRWVSEYETFEGIKAFAYNVFDHNAANHSVHFHIQGLGQQSCLEGGDVDEETWNAKILLPPIGVKDVCILEAHFRERYNAPAAAVQGTFQSPQHPEQHLRPPPVHLQQLEPRGNVRQMSYNPQEQYQHRRASNLDLPESEPATPRNSQPSQIAAAPDHHQHSALGALPARQIEKAASIDPDSPLADRGPSTTGKNLKRSAASTHPHSNSPKRVRKSAPKHLEAPAGWEQSRSAKLWKYALQIDEFGGDARTVPRARPVKFTRRSTQDKSSETSMGK